MEKRRRVYLYGNSIILGTLGTSLRRNPRFEVTTLIPPLPQGRELEALSPDVVLFDLEAARPEVAFSLLESCPELLLIGVSPDTNLVKVWSGRQLRELSMQGLMEVINERSKDSAADSGSTKASNSPTTEKPTETQRRLTA